MPCELDWRLEPAIDPSQPYVENAAQRYADAFPENVSARKWSERNSIEDWFWEEWRGLGSLPLAELEQIFDEQEIMRLAFRCRHSNRLRDALREDCRARFVTKIQSSLWHFGGFGLPGFEYDWNVLVRHYTELATFSLGHPDFEVRVDHVYYAHERGRPVFHLLSDLYLDGEFGFIVYFRGDPVLTIGFSFSPHGVLLQQVQCIQKKGNRWLYRLKKPVLEHVVNCFSNTFSDPLWIVDGTSAVEFVRRTYTPQAGVQFDESAAPRIQALYDRPLPSFERSEVRQINRTLFHRLVRRRAEQAA